MILSYKLLNLVCKARAKKDDYEREYLYHIHYDKENDAICTTDNHNLIIIKDKKAKIEDLKFLPLDNDNINLHLFNKQDIILDNVGIVNNIQNKDFSKLITNELSCDKINLLTVNPIYLKLGHDIVKYFYGSKAYPPQLIHSCSVCVYYSELSNNLEMYQLIAPICY